MIKFSDLYSQYLEIRDEIDKAISECITNSEFVRGKSVTTFEKAFAAYTGSDYCIGCGNGTDALEIIMSALGIGPGDEVIVPALTWIATAAAVSNVGAEPVFVDVNRDTCNIDYSMVEQAISANSKAIIPVHLYGCPADMNELMRLAEKHGLHVIEDCAQAHGAEYNNRKVGSLGKASAFSFFPSKNLGAFGDGGAIVTNDAGLADKMRRISNHGQSRVRHEHSIVGRNSRLDSIQASVLLVKLKHLDEWNNQRVALASRYKSCLEPVDDFILPVTPRDRKHVFHLFVVRCGRREDLTRILDEGKIAWGIHYPRIVPLTGAYKYKNHSPSDFPVANKITEEIISLPLYPGMPESLVDMICNHVKSKHM
jgi:dTDP-4-amino-4,6-dideoxygalactose transaminase